MKSYVRWVTGNAKAVLLGVMLLTLGLQAGIPRLRLQSNLENNLPRNHPYIKDYNTITARFGLRDMILVVFQTDHGTVFDPAFLEMIRQSTVDLASLPGFSESTTLSLTSKNAKEILASKDGDGVQTRPLANPVSEVYRNLLASEDLKSSAIVLNYKPDGEPHYQKMENGIRATVEKHLIPGVRYGLNGSPVVMSAMEKYTRAIAKYFLIAVLVIGLIHFEAFRSFQGLVLPLVTALLAVVWSTGLLCWLGYNTLDPITAPTPILILAIAAGHAVQVLKRYYEEYERCGDNVQAVQDSLVKVGPVMLLAGSIAIASFLSLLLFDIPAIRNFGLYSALGVAAALVIEMTFIPALRALMPAPRSARAADHALLDRCMTWLSKRLVRPACFKPVLIAALVLSAACALFATRIVVDTSERLMLPKSEKVIADEEWIGKSVAGIGTLWFLIDGKEDDLKRPDVLHAVDNLDAFLEAQPGVGKVLGLPFFVKETSRAVNGGKSAAYAIPEREDLIAQYLFLYSMGVGPGSFDSYVTPAYDKAVVTVFTRDNSTAFSEKLIAKTQAYAQKTFPAGIRVGVSGSEANISAINRVIVNGKLRNILQILCVVLLLTSLVFRSFTAGVFAIIPIVVTVLVNFGIMGLGGIRLDLATAIVSALAVGIGADYAVYFISRLREEFWISNGEWVQATQRTLLTTGKGVFFVSSAVGLGYLTLCASPFRPHFFMGFLVGTAMFTSSVSAVVLLPVLSLVFKPRFLTKGVSSDNPLKKAA